MPFQEFMRLALYHPGGGYYTRSEITTGRRGDFSTMSDVSPAFGQRLAVQVGECAEALDADGWDLIELGPGRGLLCSDLLDGLARHAPQALERLRRVVLVEISQPLRTTQHHRLSARLGDRLVQLESLDELPPQALTGVVVANELFDALPVACVVRRGGRLLQRSVAIAADGSLSWVDGPAVTHEQAAELERWGLCAQEGWIAELCPLAEPLVRQLGSRLARGAVLVLDYGHEAARLADAAHADGTLIAYRGHRSSTKLLDDPGRQDLTAHVHWDRLEEFARRAGFALAGRTAQDRFLLALGIAEEMTGTHPEALAARALVLPADAGKSFSASLWLKGVELQPRGLRWPP